MKRRQPYDLQEASFGSLLHDIARLRTKLFDRAWKPLGITRSQRWLLIHISQKHGMTQRQLAEATNISEAAIGESLRIMEAAGLVIRALDRKDGRKRLVFLSDAGEETLEKTREIFQSLQATMLKGVSAEQLQAARQALETIHANARAYEDE